MKPKKMSAANKRFYLVLAAIVVALVGWWGWLQVMPRPLGDKLEYIGKEDYGSWLPLSSARPASVYYYATDMSKEEVREYFVNADTHHPIDISQGVTRIWLQYKGLPLLIEYYPSDSVKHHRIPKSPNGKNIISVSSEQYNTAKDALK